MNKQQLLDYIDQFPSNGITQSIHAYVKQMSTDDSAQLQDKISGMKDEMTHLKQENEMLMSTLAKLRNEFNQTRYSEAPSKVPRVYEYKVSEIVIDEIVKAGIGNPLLKSRAKPQKIHPKTLYVWFMTRLSAISITKMGRILNVDHTTILHHRDLSHDLYNYDFVFKEKVNILLPKVITRVHELDKSFAEKGVDPELLLQQASEN